MSAAPASGGSNPTPRSDGTVDFAVLGLRGVTQDEIREAYCQRYAEQLCAARAKCCTALSAPDTDCVGDVEDSCYLDTSNGTGKGALFSSERVKQVFEALEQAVDTCAQYNLPQRSAPFAPTSVAPGGDCNDSGLYQEPQCAAGTRCDRRNGNVCVDVVPDGGACTYEYECGSESVCANKQCAPMGKQQRALGEACGSGLQCASGACNGGNVCAACTSDANCVNRAGAGLSCVQGRCGTFSACQPRATYRP
jgi:hypothetical protein